MLLGGGYIPLSLLYLVNDPSCIYTIYYIGPETQTLHCYNLGIIYTLKYKNNPVMFIFHFNFYSNYNFEIVSEVQTFIANVKILKKFKIMILDLFQSRRILIGNLIGNL